MPKLPSGVNGPRRFGGPRRVGQADPPERHVGDEQRQRDQQDRRAQGLFGFAPVTGWIEGFDRVMDDAPTAKKVSNAAGSVFAPRQIAKRSSSVA